MKEIGEKKHGNRLTVRPITAGGSARLVAIPRPAW